MTKFHQMFNFLSTNKHMLSKRWRDLDKTAADVLTTLKEIIFMFSYYVKRQRVPCSFLHPFGLWVRSGTWFFFFKFYKTAGQLMINHKSITSNFILVPEIFILLFLRVKKKMNIVIRRCGMSAYVDLYNIF